MDVADLPGASMLDVPGTGGVEPKDGSHDAKTMGFFAFGAGCWDVCPDFGVP